MAQHMQQHVGREDASCPSTPALRQRHGQGGDADVGTTQLMLGQPLRHVHAVDVVDAAHCDQVGPVGFDQLDVLRHGVGPAVEPLFAVTHVRACRARISNARNQTLASSSGAR